MKKDIHPAYNPTVFVDVSTGAKFITHSSIKTKETEVIDGVEYQKSVKDVTMASHPAYTGEKRFVDTAGRVEKFQNRFRRRG